MHDVRSFLSSTETKGGGERVNKKKISDYKCFVINEKLLPKFYLKPLINSKGNLVKTAFMVKEVHSNNFSFADKERDNLLNAKQIKL